jgi:hypothetical protein
MKEYYKLILPLILNAILFLLLISSAKATDVEVKVTVASPQPTGVVLLKSIMPLILLSGSILAIFRFWFFSPRNVSDLIATVIVTIIIVLLVGVLLVALS